MLNKLSRAIGAGCALLLSLSASPAPAARGDPQAAPPRPPEEEPADVPAPPMALLFAIAAVGLVWGRRLTAGKAREHAKPD